MRYLLFIVLTITSVLTSEGQNRRASIEPYIQSLNGAPEAADYIFSLFDKHDIVILCMREHSETEQYRMLAKVIEDKRFAEKVGNIFYEIGAVNLKQRTDDLVLGEKLSDSDINTGILALQRDASSNPVWSRYSYYMLLSAICRTNRDLSADDKIRLYPIDIPVEWNKIRSEQTYKAAVKVNRDSVMAANTVRFLNILPQEKRKALIVMNNRLAFSRYDELTGHKNYMYWLGKMTATPIARVLINDFTDDDDNDEEDYLPIHNGKWEAVFTLAGHENIGFDFERTPFGEDRFDMMNDIPTSLKYGDIFTGMIYLPLEKCRYVWGTPGLISDGFAAELARRYRVIGLDDNPKIGELKKTYNTVEELDYREHCPLLKTMVGKFLK